MTRANKSMSGIEGMRNVEENIKKMRSTVIVTHADGSQEEVKYAPPKPRKKVRTQNPRKHICQYCKNPSHKTTCDECAG